MDITAQGYVRTDITPNGAAHIIFFHPAHNSLPSKLLNDLVAAFEAASKHPDVKIVVLRSAEHNTFCAGASFDELMTIPDIETGHAFFSGFGNVINAMRTCSKIVIGRVHGKSVGGGVGLASATDFCLATKWATFRLSELAVGFGPFVIGPAVERKVGIAAFTQLSLTPDEWRTAEWGKANNLYQDIFETPEQMDGYLETLCDKLCAYSPEALKELKRVFWRGTEHWDTLLAERAAISGWLSQTDYARKAIEGFKKG